MPIVRPLDFFTKMGPSDVLLAGHFLLLPSEDAGNVLQITPPQCLLEVNAVGPGNVQYLVTLPGTGSLDIAGVCTSFGPQAINTNFRHIVHSYDRETRTIEFRLLEAVAPGPPDEVPLQEFEAVFFWVHLYESKPQAPNLIVEAP